MKNYMIVCMFTFLLFGIFACQGGNKQSSKQVIVTAHRGASGLAPENTIAAMLKAMEIGADYAELDVQEIADSSLILFHDLTLERTTNATGNIWEMTLKNLQGVDAGSWFDADYAGEPIPTLESVIDTVHGKMKLNIELKMNGHEKSLVEQVVNLVLEKNFMPECIITSFDREAVRKVKQLNPSIKTGYIFRNMPEEDIFNAEFDLFSIKKNMVNEEFVKKAHRHSKEVHVWTVNDAEEMRNLISYGVDAIITDRPDILLGIIRQQ
ncbi:MAG: glycerophosphodiester phosphodiesterase [bacterium]